MPDRRTHRSLSICSGIVAAAPLAFLIPASHFVAFEAGVALTVIFAELTPDLDISTRHFSWLGEFIGLKSYAKLIPHRYGTGKKHWTRLKIWHIFLFSHIPLVGTLLRTLLCTLPLLVALMLLGITDEKFWQSLGWYWLWLWFGMSWSDCWHVIADRPWSKRGDKKEMTREFWYGKQKEQRLFYRKTNRL